MELHDIRAEIDRIDRKIVELINERYKFVKKVGNYKNDKGAPIYVPEREKALLSKLCEINPGPMQSETLRAVYREIMSGALQLEKPLKVTFLGPAGSFTHQAAISRFGQSVELTEASSIAGVFKDIETGRADYGCVPVENSTEGAVNYTLDTLMMTNVNICSELNLRIHHNLMSREPFENIERVYSHSQVFGQCREYIQEHLAHLELIETVSTARAAKNATLEPGAAALAGKAAADLFGLHILAENIEDFSSNTTRFLILGKQQTEPTGDDKTSVCFAIKDKIGALYDCIKPFKDAKLTMTMIESRPTKNANWEYCFFIDLLGHRNDPEVLKAFENIEQQCSFFKVLGSYPRNTG
ncbi:prephenate dehydratase [Lentisphaerota bacterium ZTH]|nr:prephenate dehydratase [Lentisphaerota bacterium]WET06976.1 prephenate dehydratase [Lentisphaerota bacterium ZTH]